MADEKRRHGSAGRRRVADDEPYEVNDLADKHGISRAQAEQLLRFIGQDRARLDLAAQRLARGH